MNTKAQKIKSISIKHNSTILDALKHMDRTYKRLLLVFKDGRFINVLSIGDIQRAIIRNKPMSTPIIEILRHETRVEYSYSSFEHIKEQMLKYKTECMPILDENNQLVDVYFWEDVFNINQKTKETNLNLPVVIMAGGKGTRLKPLTNVIPKPLIPLGDKTIIEEIIDRFSRFNCNVFYISVNYKADTIKHFFNQLKLPYEIYYINEDKPLGTAGSLHLLKTKLNTTFIVTNCDILIEEDYAEIYKFHKSNKYELTIVAALKHYPIPYGTIETGENGELKKIIEKPELIFKVNSGMYIFEPHLLEEIPVNRFFNLTDLIDKIIKRNGKVGVFPVTQNSWRDIGNWDEYLKNLSNV